MKNLILFLMLSCSVYSQEIHSNLAGQTFSKIDNSYSFTFKNMDYQHINVYETIIFSSLDEFLIKCLEVIEKDEKQTTEGLTLSKTGRSVMVMSRTGFTVLSKSTINKVKSKL